MLPDRSNHNRAARAAPRPQPRRFFFAEGREPSGLNTALKLPHDATRPQQSQPGGLRRTANIATPIFDGILRSVVSVLRLLFHVLPQI
jgi:hypothetical protein